jgi:hypothetical protein
LQEGIAIGRSFAMLKSYNVDGNKEMIAFGAMNIVGSCTSCYLTAGIQEIFLLLFRNKLVTVMFPTKISVSSY